MPTQQGASQDLARDAEGLLRCLTGVTHVRVRTGPRGIDAVHIVAADHHIAPRLAAQVRSALLAGLATPIIPARIHVRVENDADHDDHTVLPATNPPHRIRILEHLQADPDQNVGPVEKAPPVEIDEQDQPGDSDPVAIPRLATVDLDRRDDGRILCRVSVAFRTSVYSDEALAVDLPGAAAHAAAQAAVRALVRGGLDGLELDGLREVEIAGRHYAFVALRRVDTSRRVRSGSALITASPERAAALAAVAAAKELL